MTRNTAVAQADELRTFFTRVRPYYRELFNMAHAVCGNYEVAEYAVQSAMLEVFRRGTPRSRAGLRETLRAQTRSMALEQARLIDDAELTWDGFRADAIEGAGGDLVVQVAQALGQEREHELVHRKAQRPALPAERLCPGGLAAADLAADEDHFGHGVFPPLVSQRRALFRAEKGPCALSAAGKGP